MAGPGILDKAGVRMRQQKHGGGKREQRRAWAQDRADGRRQAKAITGANRRQQEVNSEGRRRAWARLRLRTVSCERMRTDCGTTPSPARAPRRPACARHADSRPTQAGTHPR